MEKQTLFQGVLGLVGKLLTQTRDIFRRWNKHFKDLLILAIVSTFKEADSEDLGKDESIAMADVNEIVKKLPGGRVPG